MIEGRTEAGAVSYHWVIDASEIENADDLPCIAALSPDSFDFWRDPCEDVYE